MKIPAHAIEHARPALQQSCSSFLASQPALSRRAALAMTTSSAVMLLQYTKAFQSAAAAPLVAAAAAPEALAGSRPGATSTSTSDRPAPSGMTLSQARAAASASISSLQSAYSDLVTLSSCTAVEPPPDCVSSKSATALLQTLAGSCRQLLIALPIVAADIAYSGSPAKRRSGFGGLLDALEAATRQGESIDTADLEWVELVEDRSIRAVGRLEELEAALREVQQVVAAGGGGAGREVVVLAAESGRLAGLVRGAVGAVQQALART